MNNAQHINQIFLNNKYNIVLVYFIDRNNIAAESQLTVNYWTPTKRYGIDGSRTILRFKSSLTIQLIETTAFIL